MCYIIYVRFSIELELNTYSIEIYKLLLYIKCMYERKYYLDQLLKFADENTLKIVSGVSGCGKTELIKEVRDKLNEIQDKLIEDRKPEFYIDFESTTWSDISDIFKNLIKYKGPKLYYVIIDNFNPTFSWEEDIVSLLENNVSVFITTSNKSVYQKFITDDKYKSKYRIIKVDSFSYNEMSEYAKSRGINYDVYEYIKYGGFPDLLDCKSDSERKKILAYRLNKITSEIIARYNIRKSRAFSAFTRMVVCNESPLMPFLAMAKKLSETEKCSANTLTQWMTYLEEAFFVESVSRILFKDKKELASKRYYICDPAFRLLGAVADDLLELNYETAFYKCVGSLSTCDFIEFRKKGYEIIFSLSAIKQAYFSDTLDYKNCDSIKITHQYSSVEKVLEEPLDLETFFKKSIP